MRLLASGSIPIRWVVVLALALPAGACEFGRKRPTTPILGQLEVRSDPSGAAVLLDGSPTGAVTPTTLSAAAGTHQLRLEFGLASEFFVWDGEVAIPETASATIDAALVGGCFFDCPFRLEANRASCLVTGVADFCSSVFNPGRRGQSAWPAGSGNEYVAGLRLLVGAIVGPDGGAFQGDTVASLVYQGTWIGRSPVSVTSSTGADVAAFLHWSDPGPTVSGRLPLVGIEVDQRVIAPDSAAFAGLVDVVFFRFAMRNVTGDPRFRDWHPEIPEGGLTYMGLYAGMGLDADIGNPGDDVGTALPDLGVAFIYDLDFQDSGLSPDYADRPPLVGLILVERPTLASRQPFSLWRITDDWDNDRRFLTDDDLGFGYRVLTAQLRGGDPIADCTVPDDEIGFCSDAPDDYRLSVTGGPIDLVPGDSAVFALALVFGEPAPGFTSGTPLEPGLPTMSPRPIEAVADTLVARASRARALWPEVWSQVQ